MLWGVFGSKSCSNGVTAAEWFPAGAGVARRVSTQRTLPAVAPSCRQAGVGLVPRGSGESSGERGAGLCDCDAGVS